jgi:peptidoglycan/xylan/chitin deacetylase (PgdA/CDA1 family)
MNILPSTSAALSDGRYLIRFDDICSSMNWAVWDAIESQLIRHSVRPILAVVPDNRDPKLIVDSPRADFWERVRRWQRAGYTIALHGYEHRYVNNNAGLMRLTYQSEFAGLSRNEQEAKLRRGLEIFSKYGVHADAWAAPAHSFDRTTVAVLADLGVSVISDGLWPWPFTDARGVTWVPQQLWHFAPKPAGIWTVCCHHNNWTPRTIEDFAKSLEAYASKMTDMATVIHSFAGRRATLTDQWTALSDWTWNHYLMPGRIRYRRIANRIGLAGKIRK